MDTNIDQNADQGNEGTTTLGESFDRGGQKEDPWQVAAGMADKEMNPGDDSSAGSDDGDTRQEYSQDADDSTGKEEDSELTDWSREELWRPRQFNEVWSDLPPHVEAFRKQAVRGVQNAVEQASAARKEADRIRDEYMAKLELLSRGTPQHAQNQDVMTEPPMPDFNTDTPEEAMKKWRAHDEWRMRQVESRIAEKIGSVEGRISEREKAESERQQQILANENRATFDKIRTESWYSPLVEQEAVRLSQNALFSRLETTPESISALYEAARKSVAFMEKEASDVRHKASAGSRVVPRSSGRQATKAGKNRKPDTSTWEGAAEAAERDTGIKFAS